MTECRITFKVFPVYLFTCLPVYVSLSVYNSLDG
jgi:hypothetical protein